MFYESLKKHWTAADEQMEIGGVGMNYQVLMSIWGQRTIHVGEE